MSRTSNINMLEGPIAGPMFRFAFPLMISGALQILFNAVDQAVVGRFVGSEALAAVGSNGSIVQLIVTLFIGMSTGTNVLAAQYLGAGEQKDLEETVHTSILASALFGIGLIFVGFFLSGPLLKLMDTPDNVYPLSLLYLRIYFCGMPFMMIYNFGAAILRSTGDTKRPLYFMITAGIVNVVLNLIFVLIFGLGVAGVGIATVISQGVSCVMVMYVLTHSQADWSFDFHKARITLDKMKNMIRIGLPAGLQGASFSISNILIQSSINAFGSSVMAGCAAANNISSMTFVTTDAYSQACISFTGQNYGAKKYKRIDKIVIQTLIMGSVVALAVGIPCCIFGRQLMSFFTTDSSVIDYGLVRVYVMCLTQCVGVWMNTFNNVSRAMGYSLFPMVNTITCVCAFRIVWIYTIFKIWPTLFCLFISYPITWLIAAIVGLIYYLHVRKKAFVPEEG